MTSTAAAPTIGTAPGIWISVTKLLTMRASGEAADRARDNPAHADHRALAKDSRQKGRGVDPIARRMPNSRVRALTEKASTPATPTTAIKSATPAKPPNTSALTPIGRQHLRAHVIQRRGPLHRLIRGDFANDLRNGRHQRIRIIFACTKSRPPLDLLLHRVIDRHRRARDEVLVVQSAAMPTIRRGPVLTPMNFVTGSVHINWRLTASMIREHPLRDALADDDDLARRRAGRPR